MSKEEEEIDTTALEGGKMCINCDPVCEKGTSNEFYSFAGKQENMKIVITM